MTGALPPLSDPEPARPTNLPPAPNPALLPILATVTYLAALVALWGVTSLLLDRDPVDYRDAGPLLGPAMVAAACVVTWASLWRITRTQLWSWVLVALAGSFVAMLLVGAVGYAMTRSDAAWLVLAAGHFALSPFVLGAALLSGAASSVVRFAGAMNRR